MKTPHPFQDTLQKFNIDAAYEVYLYSLPALTKHYPNIARLPISLRIVLESVLRHWDGMKVTDKHIRQLANWKPESPRVEKIPFVVSKNKRST